ncbi:MAG: flagellar protein FlgN [Novosphingobium sp.]|nr:flagellar protein FlgN [Novosphingobium sp.]MCP5401053.1 flagellar protein FlgN [Novosphingobium sp.]
MMNSSELRETLRQMLAVLQAERQALADMNLDAILGTADDKQAICGKLDQPNEGEIDEECRGMLDAARRLNEVNRQVRNLIAANVTARLNALTGSAEIYNATPAYSYASIRR